MNKIIKLVLQGLAAVLPLSLTLYFVYWLLSAAETYARAALLLVVPESLYFTGMGIVAALSGLILAGLVVNAYVIRYLLQLGDRAVGRIPLVKSIYGAIQDVMRVFSLADRHDMRSVVSIDIGNDTHLIGFVTGEKAGRRLFDEDSNRVGVYLPMSYQIGGFTVYVERDRLTHLDIGVEDAMRIAITGGVQNRQR